MKNFFEEISKKQVYILTTGKLQQDFEYIFTDIDICGYIDEKIMKASYHGRPVKNLNEVLGLKDFFIIICEEKNEEKRGVLENNNCIYLTDFCFLEDVLPVLDFNLKENAGEREIVICGEALVCISRKPDLLLDKNKYGNELYGMRIEDPALFEDWEDYFIVITVEEPAEIFSILEKKGLLKYKNYIWYRDEALGDFLDKEKTRRIAFYGCGYAAAGLLKRLEWNIKRNISVEELKDCNKKNQYVITAGTVSDKIPILRDRNYTEIKDFVHLDYLKRAETLKPSELLKQTMRAPVVRQPKCTSPFDFAYITTEGDVFGCICPGWVQWGFGNIKYEECRQVWNSVYAKIFRLSIVNRTFCFCKENYCYQCDPQNPQAKNDDAQIDYEVSSYPKIVKPCIDYTCNLFCESCRCSPRIAEGTDLQECEFIAERLLKSKWLDLAEKINIAGMGEVFFSKVYRKLLYTVTNERNTVQIFSNGTLFTEKEFKRLLQCYKAIEVEISIDAAAKSTYEKLRRGGEWNTLLKNLSYLGKERLKNHIKLFTINMIVQKDNYKEIPEFIKLGKKIHADVIAIRPLMNWGTYSEQQYRDISMISHEDNWVSDDLQEVLKDPLLEEKEVDYSWFKKRMRL